VNRSGRRCVVEESVVEGESAGIVAEQVVAGKVESRRAVRLALAQVKGLSIDAVEAVLGARPFRSLGDLLRRTRIPKREVEALILAGSLDFTGLNRPQLLWELETTYEREHGRGGLGLAEASGDDWSRLHHPPLKDYPAVVKVRHEMEFLDLALTAHPLALFRDRIADLGASPIAEALQRPGQRVRVAGLVAASRRTPTKKGETMQFLTLEDETGLLETTLFPKVFRRYARQLGSLGPYIVEGMLKDRRRALSLDIEELSLLDVESQE
jgi:DNA polymerase III alpha subunit